MKNVNGGAGTVGEHITGHLGFLDNMHFVGVEL